MSTSSNAVNINSNGLQQFNGTSAFSGKTFSIKNQVFTSSGTYTPTAGMVYCIMQCVGGCGGAGGKASGSGQNNGSGGGGGGGYAMAAISAASVGASKTVTIGTGGAGSSGNGALGSATSVGTLLNGGAGTRGSGQSGGLGGNGVTGDLLVRSQTGESGVSILANPSFALGGAGGSSRFGFGGQAALQTASGGVLTPGNNSSLYGAGGAGGVATNAAGCVGGNSSNGVVIITEFIFS